MGQQHIREDLIPTDKEADGNLDYFNLKTISSQFPHVRIPSLFQNSDLSSQNLDCSESKSTKPTLFP